MKPLYRFSAVLVFLLTLGFLVQRETGAQSARDWNEKGVNLTRQGNFQEALEAFKSAYREDAGNPVIKTNLATGYANYGWWLLGKNQPESAVRAFDEAIYLQDDAAKSYLGRGLAYFRQNLLYEAVKDYERARRLDPQDPVISQRLGEAYYQRGDLSQALSVWEEALRNQPQNKTLQELVNKVKKEQKVEERFTENQGYHFVLRYEGAAGGYDREKELHEIGKEILGYLEEAYNYVGRELDYYPRDQIPVILYTNEQFQDITHAPSWAGGRYDGKIRIPSKGLHVGSSYLKPILFHEYTHAVIHFLAGGWIPAWLNEGLAQYMEGRDHQAQLSLVRQAKSKSTVLSLAKLNQGFSQFSERQSADLAYAESYSAVQFMIDRNGMYDVKKVITLLGQGQSLDQALKDVIRMNLADFENDWLRSL